MGGCGSLFSFLFFSFKAFYPPSFFLFFFFEWCFIEGWTKISPFGAQDVQIEREKQIYSVTGGCTALTVVYLLGKLYVANAGDSRCVLRPSSEQTQTIAPVCFKNNFLPFLSRRDPLLPALAWFLNITCLQGHHHQKQRDHPHVDGVHARIRTTATSVPGK